MKSITFSGYRWIIKSSRKRVGPWRNYFSDSKENVFVDNTGRLHLKITGRDGRWFCAEVYLNTHSGYGTYRFQVNETAGNIDTNAVLGLFVYADRTHEIDIECAKWNRFKKTNMQFTVQPWWNKDRIQRFSIGKNEKRVIHEFAWRPEGISFRSIRTSDGTILASGDYPRKYLKSGREKARINLWLYRAKPPADGKEQEIIIERFKFIPLDTTNNRNL